MGEEKRQKLRITERMPLTWQDARTAFAGSELVDRVFGSEFKTKYLSVNHVRRYVFLCPCYRVLILSNHRPWQNKWHSRRQKRSN
jgi:hypothetical protein